MKLCCSKCKNTLTKDMYYVPKPKGVPFTNKTWFRAWEGVEGKDGKDYVIKTGVFFIEPREKKYSWTYKDCSGVDNKKEYLEVYGNDGGQHYHHILGGNPETFVCSGDTLLVDVIPPFKKGYGCCNWSNGYPLLCKCGHKVGEMYLDCYEPNTVKFLTKNVDRVYR